MDAVGRLLDHIARTPPRTRAELRRLKTAMAASTGQPLLRNETLLRRYRTEVAQGLRSHDEQVESALALNRIRSESGIATVTVLTEPYACPGRCVYCPTEANAPKSYLTNEPAMMRAVRNDYDPYRQVRSRLETLDATGHPTDKLELIVKGGTWSFYPAAYQRRFIQRCFEAANNFRVLGRVTRSGGPCPSDPPKICGGEDGWGRAAAGPASLEDAQRINETAACRIIGITIETRPDYIDAAEILRLRELGVTRVELGVQSLEESVLALVVRDHGAAEVRQATALLRDAGYKIAYHLMPNLPGATPASDLESARQLFADPGYQPDTIKLYPCVVIESAELSHWWRDGRYVPYDDETLLELLIHIKQLVPPHVRIERVIRDIPSTSILAGCRIANLREAVQQRMRERNLRCRCIRCRQVRGSAQGDFTLVRRDYDAARGREIFLSFEDAVTDRLASLLRLRIPVKETPAPTVLQGAALIRELHSYGRHLPLHAHSEEAAQHQGFGRRLMEDAERIARAEFGLTRIAVIAGVGAREYYRRLGYELQDTYMVKTIKK